MATSATTPMDRFAPFFLAPNLATMAPAMCRPTEMSLKSSGREILSYKLFEWSGNYSQSDEYPGPKLASVGDIAWCVSTGRFWVKLGRGWRQTLLPFEHPLHSDYVLRLAGRPRTLCWGTKSAERSAQHRAKRNRNETNSMC